MDNQILLRAVGELVSLTPREVVVVLDVQQDVDAERPDDVPMDDRVIGGRMPAH